ncbi:hypothetical protein ACIQNG_06745 [Streptomyces sp. NPDC091377]|uniref:hypothetical protein n=1 Tax=Streptomyces sp. NPDC091377 TaxID=3365995 RepID=UPI003823AAE6
MANDYSKRARKGYEVLPSLEVWMPSLKERRTPMPEDAPGWGFVYFQPSPGQMGLCIRTNMAAAWPWWSEKQAARMGLLCAECGWDLRKNDGDDDHVAYNIPRRPGGWRLLCGACCNHGEDVMGPDDAPAGSPVPAQAVPSVPATFTAGGAS